MIFRVFSPSPISILLSVILVPLVIEISSLPAPPSIVELPLILAFSPIVIVSLPPPPDIIEPPFIFKFLPIVIISSPSSLPVPALPLFPQSPCIPELLLRVRLSPAVIVSLPPPAFISAQFSSVTLFAIFTVSLYPLPLSSV